LLVSEFAQAAHIFIAIDAFQGGQRLGQAHLGVGDGQTDSCAAIIQRQNGRGLSLIFGREQLRHPFSIPGIAGGVQGGEDYGWRPRVPFCQSCQ
jgi:hypothetical protein